MPRYVLALGSNLGARESFLIAARRLLAEDGTIERCSSVYRTAAMGPPAPDYANAALLLRSDLEPRALLERGLQIERWLGRERRERWGPRTIDIDFVDYDGPPISSVELELPHPRRLERAFVLAPWLDVAPERERELRPPLEALGGAPEHAPWGQSVDPLDVRARALAARWIDAHARPTTAIRAVWTEPPPLRITALAVIDEAHVILIGEPAAKVL